MSWASLSSQSMTGQMGWTPGLMSKPAAVIFSLKRFVFVSSLSRSAVEDESSSRALRVPPTMEGATVLEKR